MISYDGAKESLTVGQGGKDGGAIEDGGKEKGNGDCAPSG